MGNPWYNLTEQERITEIYSKFTIKDFWDWWSNKEPKIMEVRIKDFPLLQQVAVNMNLPYSASGVYVFNDIQLKQVIGMVRNKATIWFGVNPKKKNWNKKGWKVLEGKDTNISEVNYIMIDIDRITKNGPATSTDLESCDILANLILERLETQGWNKNYIKICSGNGVQLLIKLDFPIKMPELEFDNNTKTFIFNSEFEKVKQIIPKGVGADILKFSFKYKNDLKVEVDKACFNISRVASLPFSKNYKYDGFTWRGIIDIQNGVNVGLSDYVLSKDDDVEVYKQRNVFTTKALTKDVRLKPGKLRDHTLIKFMLDNDLPAGMRNNYLWFQVKCLIRDSGIDINGEEIQQIHREIEKKYGSLPLNIPDKKFMFDENIVNRYCIENMMPPLYPLWPKRTKRIDYCIDNMEWIDILQLKEAMSLPEDTDILKDLEILKSQLVEGVMNNKDTFIKFINGCIRKYGEKKTRYYFDYIMKRYISYE